MGGSRAGAKQWPRGPYPLRPRFMLGSVAVEGGVHASRASRLPPGPTPAEWKREVPHVLQGDHVDRRFEEEVRLRRLRLLEEVQAVQEQEQHSDRQLARDAPGFGLSGPVITPPTSSGELDPGRDCPRRRLAGDVGW